MQNRSNKLRKRRIMWIDMARGIAMLSILLFHTDSYNFEELLIPYEFYVENFLALFFFISGFLFYRENAAFDIKHKIKSLLKTLVLPYFIFTSFMALPKALVYGNTLSLDIIADIFCGNASWFVTALAVAELLFSVLISYEDKHIMKYVMPTICFACGITAVYITPSHNLWHYQNAMLAMPYLYMGFLYHKNEYILSNFFNNKTFVISASILLIVLKTMEYAEGMRMLFEPVIITSFLLFFIDTMLFIILFILLIRHVRSFKYICWTGRYSIVYYFLCGGVPLLTNRLLTILNIDYASNIAVLLIITAAVYIIATIITRIIVKYIPFVIGRW